MNIGNLKLDRDVITKTIGFLFVFIGIMAVILNNYFCSEMCKACQNVEVFNCFLLFLFVGVTFLVNGAILVIFYPMYPDR